MELIDEKVVKQTYEEESTRVENVNRLVEYYSLVNKSAVYEPVKEKYKNN